MDLYFQRFDGTAATVEDFLSCFAESSGRDLTHFALWYAQAGTPSINVATEYHARRQDVDAIADAADAANAGPGRKTAAA